MIGSGAIVQLRPKGFLMTIKDEIRSYAIRKGKTISGLTELLNAKRGTKTTSQNLNKKLSNSSLRYEEAHEIAEVLGYEIVWVEKK